MFSEQEEAMHGSFDRFEVCCDSFAKKLDGNSLVDILGTGSDVDGGAGVDGEIFGGVDGDSDGRKSLLKVEEEEEEEDEEEEEKDIDYSKSEKMVVSNRFRE